MKYSFKKIMALKAHFGLEVYQMDINELFRNDNVDETIYVFSQKILYAKIQSLWSAS